MTYWLRRLSFFLYLFLPFYAEGLKKDLSSHNLYIIASATMSYSALLYRQNRVITASLNFQILLIIPNKSPTPKYFNMRFRRWFVKGFNSFKLRLCCTCVCSSSCTNTSKYLSCILKEWLISAT